jgi:hypothetical protein
VKTSTVFRLCWLAGGIALLLGLVREPLLALLPPPRELPRADGATGRPWLTGEFQPVAGLQEIARGALPGNLPLATSWLGTDATQGRAETAWFRPSREVVHVGVAGYPQKPGIKLWAEFRSGAGAITRVDCRLADPREAWQVWSITRPPDATSVRLVAEDHSSETFGWVAFTHPYRIWSAAAPAIFQHLQIYTTVALALTLLWGPGLLLLRRETPAELRAVVLLGSGPLILAALGVALWIAGGLFSPAVLGFILVVLLWLALGAAGARRGFEIALSPTAHRALAAAALVVVAVAAKSVYSVGPEGETFRGTISRNLAAGDRLDSRYGFYVVQAVAAHLAPHAPATEKFFYPWTFFSRGPLAGLAAAPVVLATGGQPPEGFPDQRWSPFDREGFAAYRITLITLASGILVAGFLLLAPLLGEAWALVAAGLVALSPFGVHEIMFTWPKWIATAWLLTSFGLVHARRPGAAGLVLGIGFLYHPLVLLWAPWLALWAAGRAERRPTPVIATLAQFAAGAALLVLPWMLLGKFMPHLPDTPFAGQGGFFQYLLLADSNLCTWPQWLQARWLNFANTFLPLHLIVSDASFHHFRLNSTYEASGPLVKFAFVWWNTLPFGLGLGLWAIGLAAAVQLWRSFRAATALLIIGPAAFLVIYWGMDPLGLMRECGHPLFFAILAGLCATAASRGGWLARVLAHPAMPWLQLPETLLMLWLTTLLNPRPWAVDHAELDTFALGLNLAALAATAWLLSRNRPTAPA